MFTCILLKAKESIFDINVCSFLICTTKWVGGVGLFAVPNLGGILFWTVLDRESLGVHPACQWYVFRTSRGIAPHAVVPETYGGALYPVGECGVCSSTRNPWPHSTKRRGFKSTNQVWTASKLILIVILIPISIEIWIATLLLIEIWILLQVSKHS